MRKYDTPDHKILTENMIYIRKVQGAVEFSSDGTQVCRPAGGREEHRYSHHASSETLKKRVKNSNTSSHYTQIKKTCLLLCLSEEIKEVYLCPKQNTVYIASVM